MEDEDKSCSKGCRSDCQSESSDAASTIKRWDNRWTASELYDSSGTTSTSEPGEDYYPENCHSSTFDVHNQTNAFCKSQGCICQSCLLGFARIIALQGSLPNVCNPHGKSAPCSRHHQSCNCCALQPQQQQQHVHQSGNPSYQTLGYEAGKSQANHHRGVGSLDRRRRRLRNKIDREHRAKSQSDLICFEQRNKPHYCSLQQVHGPNNNNPQVNTEERLRKLENERSALHMEISILSEQVDAQSSKIIELENALQEKKDSLRHMEESLQKEVLSRSALETQKLELLSSLSEMKLRQASLEHENLALRTANPLTNGERFSRHAGHYSSLPRPPTTSKKGVAFGKTQIISAAQSTNSLAVRGVSARCLSAPVLADEEKTIMSDSVSYIKPVQPTKPFGQLTADDIGEWLGQLGLESYTNELKRWGATGNKLLDASHNQIEKELDIKNPLHRKKLLYAIESERCNGSGFLGSEKMDNTAVLRWLDDIGLPQHKESFHNAKVDGRVLHRLTTEDLLLLNVTAQLHAASLRRGIQVLRELNFEYDNLERRSVSENGLNEDFDGEKVKNRVALWTNHRVMEWLRVVDLAEYAPNMRGSGVHGGLMVYEHRFTSELLATLLSIPPAKTLLRRHLTTHFNQIVGREVVQQKREMENTLGFMPLTLTARLKIPKRTQFTLKRKKSKNEVDFGNLVCPLEESPPVSDTENGENRRVISCI
ncbi:liprin-beta-1 isoform X3 [Nasonia vitripennis]|uniref:SAM domain-containing protein n=1 Tax=Nasonia vitripennis TaxID=7425 RepID=A0A7M7QAQ0_NASVI|nr:liprin-beta-1 isoform X3 [Nasonia vitripennis]